MTMETSKMHRLKKARVKLERLGDGPGHWAGYVTAGTAETGVDHSSAVG